MIEEYNSQMLVLARKLRQGTQKGTAAATGIAQAKLSKAENGLQQLSYDDMKSLSDYYELPLSFFTRQATLTPAGHYHYRRRLSLSEKTIDAVEAKVQVLKSIIDDILDGIEIPEYRLGSYDPDELSPSEIARRVRYSMKIYRGPVQHLSAFLEANGVVVYRTDFGTDKIDGLTTITARNYKVIFLNSEMPNDRVRFSMAHELGHLVMHLDKAAVSEERVEAQADEFASEFLMPEAEIKSSLSHLGLQALAQLKRRWQVSMRALIRRARDLGEIDAHAYRNFQMYFSKMGYNKQEPIPLQLDSPTIINDAITLYKSELNYSDEELQDIMRIGRKDYLEWFTPRSVIRFVPSNG